jgi:hypothetical protein
MSFLIAQPEVLAVAADQLLSINTAVGAGCSAAAAPTAGLVPAAADLVSVLTAAQFSWHANSFQEISAQAAMVRERLATTLGISAGSYAVTEAANVAAVG